MSNPPAPTQRRVWRSWFFLRRKPRRVSQHPVGHPRDRSGIARTLRTCFILRSAFAPRLFRPCRDRVLELTTLDYHQHATSASIGDISTSWPRRKKSTALETTGGGSHGSRRLDLIAWCAAIALLVNAIDLPINRRLNSWSASQRITESGEEFRGRPKPQRGAFRRGAHRELSPDQRDFAPAPRRRAGRFSRAYPAVRDPRPRAGYGGPRKPLVRCRGRVAILRYVADRAGSGRTDHFSAEVKPSRIASFVRPARLWVPSFCIRCSRWVPTVFALTWSRAAMS